MPGRTLVYALCLKGPHKVYYVGRTKDLHRRLSDHRNSGKLETGTTVLVLGAYDGEAWQLAERSWIRFFKDLGEPLKNVHPGGMVGDPSKKNPPSPWHRRRLSEGIKESYLHGRIPWNKGIVASAEFRAKVSEAKKGKKLSPETRSRMSIARIGKRHSLETRAKISASRKEAARNAL